MMTASGSKLAMAWRNRSRIEWAFQDASSNSRASVGSGGSPSMPPIAHGAYRAWKCLTSYPARARKFVNSTVWTIPPPVDGQLKRKLRMAIRIGDSGRSGVVAGAARSMRKPHS